MKQLIRGIGLLLAVVSHSAQSDATWESHVVSSPILGEREVEVFAPPARTAATRLPVVYLLDGESNADHTRAVNEYLASNGRAPDLIIVAVKAGTTRTQDYLPTESIEQGRADDFLAFIGDTLVPFVEKKYPAAPLRIISAHSYGAVFSLYALSERPDLFSAYFLQSPYLDGRVSAPVLETLAESLSDRQSPAFVYANMGAEPDLVPGLEALETILSQSGSENIEWTMETDPRQSHMTTRMMGYYDALDHFFGEHWVLSASQLKEDKDKAVSRHLQRLRQRFGYDVVYSETQYAQAAQTLLATGEIPAAGRVAHEFAKVYPNAPLPLVLRAQALAMSGDRDAARSELRRARQILDRHPDREEWQPLIAAVQEMSRAIR